MNNTVNFIKFIRYSLSARIYRFLNISVKYKGFALKSSKDFDDYIYKRVEDPMKLRVLDLIKKDTSLPSKFSLLDVGCGPGLMAQMILKDCALKERVAYTGIDQSENAIRYLSDTVPKHYNGIVRDVLEEGLPIGDYDVIMLNGVVEHMPNYTDIVMYMIKKKPKVIVITSFAIIPSNRKDRIRWRDDAQCYMNSYSFNKFHNFLREKTKSPIYILDFGDEKFNRYWFPKKSDIGWYIMLSDSIKSSKKL